MDSADSGDIRYTTMVMKRPHDVDHIPRGCEKRINVSVVQLKPSHSALSCAQRGMVVGAANAASAAVKKYERFVHGLVDATPHLVNFKSLVLCGPSDCFCLCWPHSATPLR